MKKWQIVSDVVARKLKVYVFDQLSIEEADELGTALHQETQEMRMELLEERIKHQD